MIKGVCGSGSIRVDGGYMTYPQFSTNSQNPICGVVRYNPNSTNVEVFDGYDWRPVGASTPMVSLTPSAESAINWAYAKMAAESKMEAMSVEYPAIKDLLNQQADIQHKIDMVMALVKTEAKV